MPAPSVAISFDAELTPFINQMGAADLPQASRSGKGYSLYKPSLAMLFTDPPFDGVPMPAETRSAYVFVKNGGIRARTDGANPSATSGFYIPAGTLLQFRGQAQTLQQFRFVDSQGETSEVSCMWFA